MLKAFIGKKLGMVLYDRWFERGVLSDILGERGIIGMGIRRKSTVEDAIMCNWRRRRHHMEQLNNIGADLN